MARQEAPPLPELPERSTGNNEYTVEVTPEFHGNKTSSFTSWRWTIRPPVTARTPDQPLHIKSAGCLTRAASTAR